jgi:DNA polymerase (family 10)
MPVQNAEIAAMFDEAADLLDIKGDNPFRSRAYHRAARVLAQWPENVGTLLKQGKNLDDLPGIGEDLAGKIADIVATGKFSLLESLKHELPGELPKIAALPGLGPKRVKQLHDALGIKTIEDLRRAVAAGRLKDLRGFGAQIEAKISAALAKPRAPARFKIPFAEAEAQAVVAFLKKGIGHGRIEIAGSLRRRRDTIGDVDVVAWTKDGAALGGQLRTYENVAEVLAQGQTRTSVVLRSRLQIDLRVVPEESFGAALLYFTGSKAHNIALRSLANEHGWKLNEYGLFAGKRRIAGASEAEIYKKLGLTMIPPELREDRGEIALAKTCSLPDLVTLADLRGDLHVHSDWSDGTDSIAAMAAAARARGYRYMALTDHSQRVTIAHGLDGQRLARQMAAIDKLNAETPDFTVLKGMEVDILADGSLDLSDHMLARLDIVVAAIHSKFDLSRAAQTDRLIKAMDNPHVSIIAHPTGRLIGERDAYALDLEKLISAARERGCALEINAHPDRLDLDDVGAHAAKEAGVLLAIDTDSHSVTGLDNMRFGVDQARRGWLTAADVLNTKPLTQLKKHLKR